MLMFDVSRCTGVLSTDSAAELCRRCERANSPAGERSPWIEPMARIGADDKPVCEYVIPSED